MVDWIISYLDRSNNVQLDAFLILGIMLVAAMAGSAAIRWLRLPSIVGTLLIGIALGPSLLNLVPHNSFANFEFITNVTLAMVALSLGLEFNMATVRSLGAKVIVLILCESLLTFLAIGVGLWLLTNDMVIALIGGSVGAASAPSGPVAVVKEKRARGRLTSTIFAVVGFDDAVGIFIFSFAHAFARHLLIQRTPGISDNISSLSLLLEPIKEISLSVVVGLLAGLCFWLISRKSRNRSNLFIWLFGILFLLQGLDSYLKFSTILASMMLGMVVVNCCDNVSRQNINQALESYIPVIFALFFVFAGIQLDVRILPSISILSLVYLICRGGGKFLGSFIGASIGGLGKELRAKIWMGLLSQIGVGVGLVMIVVHDFSDISSEGRDLSLTILGVVTATSLVFEVLGPWLTEWALNKSGEIPAATDNNDD